MKIVRVLVKDPNGPGLIPVHGYADPDLHQQIARMLAQAPKMAQLGHEIYSRHMEQLHELQMKAQRYVLEHPVEGN
jgi:hypothetical protein